MPFDLVEEHVMLRDLVVKFVDNEQMPLEKAVMAREAAGGGNPADRGGAGAAAHQAVGFSRRAGPVRRHGGRP